MAKKYIDAQKLKEEIQANLAAISFNDDYQEGYEACGMSVLKSIDSLQQEQSEVDLEKELESFVKENIPYGQGGYGDMMRIARHFYELGKNSK